MRSAPLDPGRLPPALRAALGPLAALYGFGVGVRNLLYDRGWIRARRLPVPTISVGNLSTGGTGKTPMVAALARKIRARGKRPGILARGYGAAGGPNEETLELGLSLPEVPLVEDPDRLRGGRTLLERGVDVAILDDGFQHRRLARDLDVVLLDATRPFDRDRLLPAGLLREPPRGLARAGLLVLTRADQAAPEEKDRLWSALRRIRAGVPRVEARHAPVGVLEAASGRVLPPEALRGLEVFLLSAIGNPRAFAKTAVLLGARTRGEFVFRDHHSFTARDLAAVAAACGTTPVLATGKDWPKLRGRLRPPCLVLQIEVEFTAGEEAVEEALDSLLR